MRALLLLIGACLFAVPAQAQKNCKKGIPCGNTCISADKVCHIGGGAAATSSRPTAQPLLSTPAGTFVGSKADKVYFLSSCTAAQDLAPKNRKEFATTEEAERAGYRRSRVEGC
jgi:hypothetical protein